MKINYYLGLAYAKTGQPLKALKYYEKSNKCLKKNKDVAESFCLREHQVNEMEKYNNKYHKVQSYEFIIKKKAKEVEYYLK